MFKNSFYSSDSESCNKLQNFVDVLQIYLENKNHEFSKFRDKYYIYGGACFRAYHGYENGDVDIFFRDFDDCRKFLILYIENIDKDFPKNAPYIDLEIDGIKFQIIVFMGGKPEDLVEHSDFLCTTGYFEDGLIKLNSKAAHDAFVNKKLTLNNKREISIHTLKRYLNKIDLINCKIDKKILNKINKGIIKNKDPKRLIPKRFDCWFLGIKQSVDHHFDEYNEYDNNCKDFRDYDDWQIPSKNKPKSIFDNYND